jgi:transposase InsO family protein
VVSRFRFVEDHRHAYGVKRLCRVLNVARSGFYRWKATAPMRQRRQKTEDQWAERIRDVYNESRRSYGAPRVVSELRAQGHRINRKRVARIMRARGFVGRHQRTRRTTTRPAPVVPAVPDLLERDFSVGRPNERWCGDITYLPVAGRWMYLASVLDIGSRRVLGYSLASHMRAELVRDALQAAVTTRGGQVDGVVFHSDHGAQYHARLFSRACQHAGIRQSMGAVGSSADNALSESWFATLKRELLHDRRWWHPRQARRDVLRWISYYNQRRRHSALGMLSPIDYEHRATTLALTA